MTLTVFRYTAGEVTRTLGPYVQDYFRCDGIGILTTSLSDSISIQASTISSAEGPTQRVTFATFTAILQENLLPRAEEKVCIDFAAHTLRERCVLGRERDHGCAEDDVHHDGQH